MAMEYHKFLSVCIIVIVGSIRGIASTANVRLSFTQKGISHAHSNVVENVVKEIEGLKIPRVSKQIESWFVSVRVALFDSVVKKATRASSSLRTDPTSDSFKLLLELSTTKIEGRYKMVGTFRQAGSYKLKISGMKITKHLGIEIDSKGRPVVVSRKCVTEIRDLSMKFENSWFLNIASLVLKKTFKTTVSDLVCRSVTNAIAAKAQEGTASYQVHYSIPRVGCSSIEVPLVRSPIMETNRVDFFLQANVTSSCYSLDAPTRRRVTYHHVPRADKMLSIYLSDNFFNSLAELYFKAGKLTKTIVISKNKIFINPVQAFISFTQPPVIATTSSGAQFFASIFVVVNSTTAGSKIPHSIGIDLVVNGNVSVDARKQNLRANITSLRVVPFFPQKSKSPMFATMRTFVLNYIASNNKKMIKMVNAGLRNIAPLPLLKGMKLTNTDVTYGESYTLLSADVI